jgi:hypothetical protein
MRRIMREMMLEMMQDEDWRGFRNRRERQFGSGADDRPWPRGWGMMRDRAGTRMGGPMHGAGLNIVFSLIDADADGTLSLSETQDFHARIFRAVDGNSDDRIDKDELRSFFGMWSRPDADNGNNDEE